MIAVDFRLLCTALGYMAVATKKNTRGTRMTQATETATLIEAFCRETLPEHFKKSKSEAAANDDGILDRMIEEFKTVLREKEAAVLPEDRATLLKFYDRLQQRQTRRQQKAFYDTAPDDLIDSR